MPATPHTEAAHRIPVSRSELQICQQQRQRPSLLSRDSWRLVRHLAPLLSIETGVAHPHFPQTMLHYSLLTEAELDELAHFYHQRAPSQFSMQYPMPMVSRWNTEPTREELEDVNNSVIELRAMMGLQTTKEDLLSLCRVNNKRRRFGRFIGLKGMESAGLDMEGTMREEMERWVERELRRREARDSELEAWRSKGF
ncbi:uncharacterized protein KY384_008379 [Bacidia gigantensis]|uniref:uncharacterized protein n=1 Tax=Bacidia gigantensis TaxID=2732470 RepID=UPI001D047CFA|nr:uncharacterized protein KY384_008379 [Bacidia gigantensis]KAG8526950.1 hypothetical protein KY384_008379 [Bacidia gigantensis]